MQIAHHHTQQPFRSRVPVLRSADAAFVTDSLLVGGELQHDETLAADQLVELISHGVTHIIDVRAEWSDAAWVRRVWPQMHYLHHPVADAGQRIDDDWFSTGVGQLETAMTGGGTVLVHCRQGVNRAPSLVVAALLAQGWGIVDAVELVRTVRPQAAIAYASDALDWQHRRSGAGAARRRSDHERLAAWRASDPLDPTARILAARAG